MGWEPYRRAHPERPLRTIAFGPSGFVLYLILEQQRRVEILEVVWLD